MKSVVLIFALLHLQVSASFFDNFRGAVSKIESSFGKLLTNVVTNVKDTIHCTISAVGHVLINNGILDKGSEYNYKCKDLNKNIYPPVIKRPVINTPVINTPVINSPVYKPPVNIRDRRSSIDSFTRFQPVHHLDYHTLPRRRISANLERSISDVDRKIKEILGYRKVNKKLTDVSEKLKAETNRLEEISDILRRELEKMSSNIRDILKRLNFGRKETSLESVWGDIKTLHDMQINSKNSTEIGEIRSILDKVVDNLNPGHKASESESYDLEEIKSKLENITKNNDVQKQIEGSFPPLRSHELTVPTAEAIIPKTFKDVANDIIHPEKSPHNDLPSTAKSFFNFDFGAFDGITSLSKKDHDIKKGVDDTKRIIDDSQHTDRVLNDFFNNNPDGHDLFSNSHLFNFKRR